MELNTCRKIIIYYCCVAARSHTVLLLYCTVGHHAAQYLRSTKYCTSIAKKTPAYDMFNVPLLLLLYPIMTMQHYQRRAKKANCCCCCHLLAAATTRSCCKKRLHYTTAVARTYVAPTHAFQLRIESVLEKRKQNRCCSLLELPLVLCMVPVPVPSHII